jgi:preprotein translocase subunit YajC
MMNLVTLAMAAPQGGGAGGQQQSPAFMIGWLVLMVGIFYFMMIRPQQRREKERRALLDAVKSGDRVIFSGGMLGMVTNVKDKILVIKIAENVKVEVVRSAVAQVLGKDEEPAAEAKK